MNWFRAWERVIQTTPLGGERAAGHERDRIAGLCQRVALGIADEHDLAELEVLRHREERRAASPSEIK
jgi:hypothetical protein